MPPCGSDGHRLLGLLRWQQRPASFFLAFRIGLRLRVDPKGLEIGMELFYSPAIGGSSSRAAGHATVGWMARQTNFGSSLLSFLTPN